MNTKLLPAALLLAMTAPVAQATVFSIDDLTDTLGLYANLPGSTTIPGQVPPGSGTLIDSGNAASFGLSNYLNTTIDENHEQISFTFVDHVNWGSNVYFYRYYTGTSLDGNAVSDLFVIQGLAGTTSDHVTFISSDMALGIDPRTLVPLLGGSNATPSDLGTVLETGDWQLAYNSGPDQYYIRSDAPEPGTLGLFALGAGLLGFRRRKAA